MGGEIMKRYIMLGMIVAAVAQLVVLRAQAQVARNPQSTVRAAPGSSLSSLNPPLITGTVTPDGTTQTPTNAFTITHPSAGRYVITFVPQVFGNVVPACIVMPIGPFTVNDIDESVNTCDFTMFSMDGSPANTFFNLMAAPITGIVPLRSQ
jgi:hypothetical protein